MAIQLKTHKLLWVMSGGKCARCKQPVVEDATEVDDPSLVGEEAHIVSSKEAGPRHDDPLPLDQRDLYANLLILCNRCHKVVDDQINTYTAGVLRQMKAEHEAEVKKLQSAEDIAKQKDDLRYAEFIDYWSREVDLEHWTAWTSWFLSGDAPSIHKEFFERLSELRPWIISRIWPGRYPELEMAMHNFRLVLQDLQNTFSKHADYEPYAPESLVTRKFYKSDTWQDDFDVVLKRYEFHLDVLADLIYELTRAANLVCDRVRQFVSPTFRLQEGYLITHRGPDLTFKSLQIVPRYRKDEITGRPYPGLERFLEVRSTRDFHEG